MKLVNVEQIAATQWAFAAIEKDGQVVTRGSKDQGGNSDAVRQELAADVEQIAAMSIQLAKLIQLLKLNVFYHSPHKLNIQLKLINSQSWFNY